MSPAKQHKYIISRVKYWRDRLCVDNRITISIKFETPSEDDIDAYACCHLGDLPYFKATIVFFPKALETKQFLSQVDSIICHEVLHILMGDLFAYVESKTEPRDADYLTKLEENLVCCLERAFCTEAVDELNKESASRNGSAAVK